MRARTTCTSLAETRATAPAKFLVFLVKDKGAMVLTPVNVIAVLQLDDAGAGFGAEHD